MNAANMAVRGSVSVTADGSASRSSGRTFRAQQAGSGKAAAGCTQSKDEAGVTMTKDELPKYPRKSEGRNRNLRGCGLE